MACHWAWGGEQGTGTGAGSPTNNCVWMGEPKVQPGLAYFWGFCTGAAGKSHKGNALTQKIIPFLSSNETRTRLSEQVHLVTSTTNPVLSLEF